MLNRSASLAMSTSVLKALPGKLDINRHSPSIHVFSVEQIHHWDPDCAVCCWIVDGFCQRLQLCVQAEASQVNLISYASWIWFLMLVESLTLFRDYKNISWVWGLDRKIGPRINFWHCEACQVLTASHCEGRIFLSHPHTNSCSPFSYFKKGFQKFLNTLRCNISWWCEHREY